ncbi:hypothetical protein [Polaribacter sp.]|uniref:hypothetical protein n=1 Tax=Polaribacter sp. TaxID=1920175 RepID=UPI003F6A933B
MKNIKFKLGFSLIAILFIVACSKEDSTKIETTQLKVSDFNKIGKIHNSFLTNVKDNFKIIETFTDEQEKIEAIYQFNKDFVTSLDISSTEKNLLIADLNKTKSLVKEDVLISKSFGISINNKSNSKKQENEENLFDIIENLKTDGKINNESYQILNSLSNDLKANYEGSLSDNQLKINVQLLINDFNNVGYSENTEGELVGTVLAISISSIEWWEQNPDALDNLASKSNASNKALIAPWLAADLVGGTLGAVASAGIQKGVNGDVNWEIVGWSALAAGATASTGAVGKIVKWLF